MLTNLMQSKLVRGVVGGLGLFISGCTSDDAKLTTQKLVHDYNGKVTQVDVDQDRDGKTDFTNTYFWGKNRRLSFVVYDLGPNGIPDQSARYTYDDKGRLILFEEDQGFNGKVDYELTYNYDKDDESKLAKVVSKHYLDGKLDETRVIDSQNESTFFEGLSSGALELSKGLGEKPFTRLLKEWIIF